MSEELSATVHLAVTICMVAVMLMSVVNLVIIGNGMLNDYTAKFARTETVIANSSIGGMNGKSVGGPSAYRVIEQNLGNIKDIKISFADGTTTADHKILKKKGSKFFIITFTLDGTAYKVTVIEDTSK